MGYQRDFLRQLKHFSVTWRMLIVQVESSLAITGFLVYSALDGSPSAFEERLARIVDLHLVCSIMPILLIFAVIRASNRRELALQSLNGLVASLSTIYFTISVSNPESDSEQDEALLSLEQLFHLLTFYVKDKERVVDNKDMSMEQHNIKQHMYHCVHRLFLVATRNRVPLREPLVAQLTAQISRIVEQTETLCSIKDSCRPQRLRVLCILLIYIFPVVLAPCFIRDIEGEPQSSDIVAAFLFSTLFWWIFASLVEIEQSLANMFDGDDAALNVVLDWDDIERQVRHEGVRSKSDRMKNDNGGGFLSAESDIEVV